MLREEAAKDILPVAIRNGMLLPNQGIRGCRMEGCEVALAKRSKFDPVPD